ncbi:MAG: UDP-N-acetylmuramoyl-L-alanyl-D-glutamate--2,6-diaminopimelate ligase [Verrucomicrobia bacterium]|nr:UDP-N-acetylmuramoyl-L-alanyl-D-glutamate--2,6-diaminopimelate ligase [Verrucomicrobiota bacterium]
MQVRELAAQLAPTKVEGPLDLEISGITYDSRRVTPGMVFVAMKGANVDGHDFIAPAVARGAAAVVCERNGFATTRTAKIIVSDSRAALACASLAYFGRPSCRLKVAGVTGTNGKTTVTFMLKQMLEASGVRTGLLGTVGYEIGGRILPAPRTTPESLELQDMMAQMLRAGCGACVMEVSSHALDQQRVAGAEFDVGIFTNLTRDHLDYHRTMEDYFAAKLRLFTGWPHGAKRGVCVTNVDDPFGARIARETNAPATLGFGLSNRADIRAANIRLGRADTAFELHANGAAHPVRMPLIGRHNVYNALAAVGGALALDVPTAAVLKALRSMRAAPGRLEPVECAQPFAVFVDYAHTDDALRNVLTALRDVTTGRLLLAFGCGGNRDTGKRARMGKVAAQLSDACIITSDNPRNEPPAAIAVAIQEGWHAARADGYHVELDRRRAIDQVLAMARPGDTVLIAGKGHETYQEIQGTVAPFDDRLHAREALETLGAKGTR